MPDEPEKGAGDGQPSKADVPSEIVLTVRGKETPLPIEKVKTLAQQGLHQQKLKEQLAADRSALEQDQTRYSEYQKLRAHLDANPDAAKAVALALQDPTAVLSPKVHPDDGLDPDDELPRRTERNGATPEMDELRRQMAEMMARDKKRDERDATTLLSGSIDTEVNEYPWLEKGRARDMARTQIAATMAADPAADLASVTAIMANDIRDLLEEGRTADAAKVPARRRLQTEQPRRGVPEVKVDKPPTKEDLANGKLLGMVKKSARAWGFEVD